MAMQVSELMAYLSRNPGYQPLLDIEGNRWEVGAVEDLVGTDPVQTIIEALGSNPAQERIDTAMILEAHLSEQEPSGQAQLFLGGRDGSQSYYEVGDVTTDSPRGIIAIKAGEFISGG